MNKPKIFLFCEPSGIRATDVIGSALAEDGTFLASHLSSSEGFSKHDIGLTSNWKHDTYQKHYPNGYELEWIETNQLDTHEKFLEAVKLNQSKEKEQTA